MHTTFLDPRLYTGSALLLRGDDGVRLKIITKEFESWRDTNGISKSGGETNGISQVSEVDARLPNREDGQCNNLCSERRREHFGHVAMPRLEDDLRGVRPELEAGSADGEHLQVAHLLDRC